MTDAQIEAGAIIGLGGVLAKAIHWAVNRIVASHDRATHALIQNARSEATTQAMLAMIQATLASANRRERGTTPSSPARPSSARTSEIERSRQRRTSPRGLPRLKPDDE